MPDKLPMGPIHPVGRDKIRVQNRVRITAMSGKTDSVPSGCASRAAPGEQLCAWPSRPVRPRMWCRQSCRRGMHLRNKPILRLTRKKEGLLRRYMPPDRIVGSTFGECDLDGTNGEGEKLAVMPKTPRKLPATAGATKLPSGVRRLRSLEGHQQFVRKLIYSVPSQKRGLYQNAAVFAGPRGAIRGMAIELPIPGDDSIGRLTVFFGEGAGKDTRLLFLRYVSRQIDEMAFEGSVERQRIYHCGECDITIEQRAVERARRDGRTAVVCPVCTRAFPLDDLAEEATQPDAAIETIETDAAAAQERESRRTVVEERRRRGQFHVFLCHHSRDKAAVRELARALEDEGILPWLYEERIFAGDAFQAKLEEAIAEARNIALCIGPHGLGRWQEVEYRAAYQRFIEIEELDEESAPVRTGVRVIPVLLPGASENRVPLFARQLHRVDLRASGDAKHRAAMRELVQVILGTSGRFGGGF